MSSWRLTPSGPWCHGALLVVLLALCAFPAAAQQFPSQHRGLSADTAYQGGALDHVNLLNGNLSLTLPLGSTYPVGPSLAYGLTLRYNAKVWDYEDTACFQGGQFVDYGVAVPDPRVNAGFGWTVELGRLFAPFEEPFNDDGPRWVYLSPDGGQHSFYTQLHQGYPATPQNNVWFSNDSTYLRLKRFPAGSAQCQSPAGATAECFLLEFPDGMVQEFRNVGSVAAPVRRVTRMKDRFDNFVGITYNANQWVLTDMHGRTQRVRFTAGRVSRVETTAFGGATAAYDLSYAPTTIDRQSVPMTPGCADDTPTLQVDLLTRLTLPDGGFYGMSYYTTEGAGDLSGGLRTLTLPTGGAYRWTYRGFFVGAPAPLQQGREWARIGHGVTKKELFTDAGDATPIGTWTYTHGQSGDLVMAGPDVFVPCHKSTRVTDPLGHESVHYFAGGDQRHRWSFGLPFTRCVPGQGYDPDGPFLSQEVYEGSAAAGTKVRTVRVEYGSDGQGSGGTQQERNHRLQLRTVVYHDDGDRETTESFSNFDGLGHWRTSVRTGIGPTRTEQTIYNRARGELVVDPETGSTAGSTFVMLGPNDPWVLETFDEQRMEENGEEAIEEYCFDGNTGFLSRQRVLAGTNRASHDLLSVFQPETVGSAATGRVARELLYGGDNQGAMDNVYPNLCAMSLPGQAQYRTDHTYRHGALESSTAVDACSGDAVLSLLDLDIDLRTGMASRSRDPAGLTMTFVYDTLGRITSERPEQSAWVHYEYRRPTVAQPGLEPRITVQACANGAASCSGAGVLAWQRQIYDGLGRRVREQLQSPGTGGITTHERTLTYNALGWLTAASVWDNAGLQTIYDQHDRFGRVGRIRPPGQPVIRLTYEGARTVTRETKVMLAGGSQQSAFSTEAYDREGRLIGLCEDRGTAWTGSCTGGLETRHSYDVGHRLKQVCANPNGATCGQTRDFVYDQRGFRLRDRLPEIGPSGNGFTHYSYDALGNVLSLDVAGSTEHDLRYGYDAAGRLIRVEEENAGQPRLLKEFFYARSNLGADKRAGKVVLAKRHNWVDLITPLEDNPGSLDVVVSEAFRYTGRDGQVSQRQTRYNLGSTHYAFSTGFTWDDLGNLSQLTYPRCLHTTGQRCQGTDPARTVSTTYSRGFPRTVPGFANQISYQAGGMLQRVDHANGVAYTVERDPAEGLQRPYRISTSAGWSTGIYDYDGSGNIHRIGNQTYRYDRLSRMVSGQADAGGGASRTQTAAYDPYGNLTQLVTHGTVQATPTSTATNRLTLPGTTYDGAGNLTRFAQGGEVHEYVYDAAGMMKHLRSNTDQARVFVYTASDERLLSFDCAGNVCDTTSARETWTLRGLGGQVLRVYSHPWGGGWRWERDYVYRGGQLLAAVEPQGAGGETTYHFHPDHLGSPRQITNAAGNQVAFHGYYPYGQEATDPAQSDFSLKFTAHERDQNGPGTRGMLDYMHARHGSPVLGRFLSPDPLGGSPGSSQSWNRYAYVLGNPVRYHDPFGFLPRASFDDFICVTASGRTCGAFDTATQLAIARQRYEQQQRAANGAISGPHDGGLVVAPPDMSFCSDFACQVMADVGRNATAAWALELVVSEVSSSMVMGPLFGSLGPPPLVFRAVRPNGQLHHVISRRIYRELQKHPILKGKYKARDPRLTTRAVDDAAHRGYQTWHRDLDKEVARWLRDNQQATPQQFESYLRTRYGAPDLLRRFPEGLP